MSVIASDETGKTAFGINEIGVSLGTSAAIIDLETVCLSRTDPHLCYGL